MKFYESSHYSIVKWLSGLPGSETIEKNGVVNCAEDTTEVEREKSGEPIISCMVDRIKEVNKRGFSIDVCDKLIVDDWN